MTTPADDYTVYVASTLDDDGKAAVLMTWGRLQAVLTPEVTLTTARDLIQAASNAEADIALIQALREEFRADDQMIRGMLKEIRARRPHNPGKAALRIDAVAGAKTGLPLVHIGRGSMKREMDPDTARDMAVHWIQTAVAAQIDVRMRYALGEWDRLDVVEIEELFKLVQDAGR